jgi:hypothetical protein
MYNKLMRCCSLAKIEYTRTMNVKHVSAKDLRYLNSINNEEQYPGARCAMGDEGIYMYQQSAPSTVESMNAVNIEMWARTAVDALNATLLLIRLECDRFQRMKQEAWGDDLGLPTRGKDEYDSTYTDLFSQTKFHPVWSTFVPGSPKNNILSVVPYSTLQLVCNSSKKKLILQTLAY